MRTITYQIERFDGARHFTATYTFPYQTGKTILWGLTTIKEEIDPSLVFTASCRAAVCGACGIQVNKQAVLACSTSLDAMTNRYGDTLHLSPLANFTVIRDLAIDWEEKVQHLTAAQTWFKPKDEFNVASGCRQQTADFKKINVQAGCILCGACASACNKLQANRQDFWEPFTYAKVWRFVADSRDKDAAARLRLIAAKGLWRCLHCAECVTKCPKGLAPNEDIANLRRQTIRLGLVNEPGPRHALAFFHDMLGPGRLNETKLSLRTIGFWGSLRKLPFALRLLRRGKLRPFASSPKNQSHAQIRAILQALRESEK